MFLSVSLSDMRLRRANTAEWIEVLFRRMTFGGRRHIRPVLNEGRDPPYVGEGSGGNCCPLYRTTVPTHSLGGAIFDAARAKLL